MKRLKFGLKFGIFICAVIPLFVGIYMRSNSKDFRALRRSMTLAIAIVITSSSFMNKSVEAQENDFINNTQFSFMNKSVEEQEKDLSNSNNQQAIFWPRVNYGDPVPLWPRVEPDQTSPIPPSPSFKRGRRFGGFFYRLDESGNPTLWIQTKSNHTILLKYDKMAEEYFNYNIYGLRKPKNFSFLEAALLEGSDRAEYTKRTVSRKEILQFQILTAEALSLQRLTKLSGFLNSQNQPESVYVNEKNGQIHVVDDKTSIWQTTLPLDYLWC